MDVQSFVGRQEVCQDIADPARMERLAATLDHQAPPWIPGILPPLGHWLCFQPDARQSAIGSDGHPLRTDDGLLPNVDLPRRMWAGRDFLGFADSVLQELRAAKSNRELATLMEAVTREFGCRYFALIHHDDLRQNRPDRVHLKDYPQTIAERLIEQRRYRLDPIIRGSNFAGGAFLWSEIRQIITLGKRDLAALEFGAGEGLNEGITVPYFRLGDCLGSCTFAGMRQPHAAARYLGPAQMIGVFAFQAARRLLPERSEPAHSRLALHPRPRDCILLAGRGYSNKEIARALGLTPRTVDGYLTEARRLFDAHDRTELVVSAVLAGEVGMHELLRRQPE